MQRVGTTCVQTCALQKYAPGLLGVTFYKIGMHDLIAYLNWTHICVVSYVVRCTYKNGYRKDVCLEEIGLTTHNMIPILGSLINVIGSTCL